MPEPSVALDSLCVGPILRPGEPAFAEWLSTLPSDAARSRQPLAVVMPLKTFDVIHVMQWASACGVQITVVGGGHSAHCIWDEALAIDLRKGFAGAQLESSSGSGGPVLLAGGGASMATIAKAAEAGGRMCCLGTAPTVGAGLLLQGGVGHLARWKGLAVDNIERVTCVTPDGLERTASPEQDPELFWAICGAGPNLAVVTQVVLRTFELVPVWCSEITWTARGACEDGLDEVVLLEYAAASSTCSESSSMDAMLRWEAVAADDWCICLSVSLFAWEAEPRRQTEPLDSGATRGGAMNLVGGHGLRALSSAIGRAAELRETVTPARIERASDLFARERYLLLDPTRGLPAPAHGEDGPQFWVRCDFLKSPLTPPAAAAICGAMRDAPNHSCYIHFQHAGGMAAQPTQPAGAFDRRDWEWSAVITGVHRAAQAEEVRQWVRATVASLLPFASGTYSVDLGPEDIDLAAHAFGKETRRRLYSLKAVYDPEQLLAHSLPLS